MRSEAPAKRTADGFLAETKTRFLEGGEQAQQKRLLGLEKWTDEEIRIALEASFSDGFFAAGPGKEQVSVLFGEWLGRDFDAAYAWFGSVGLPEAKKRLAHTLVSNWPAVRAGEGIQFVIDHPDFFNQGLPPALVTASMAEAAAKGVESVAEWFRFLADKGIIRGQNFRLPDGFDFKGLFSELGEVETDYATAGIALLADWRRQDPDGAFDWLLEKKGAGKLEMLFHSGESQGESVKWFGQRLGKLTPEQQREFVQSLTSRWDFSHGYLLTGVTDPGLAAEIRNIGLRKIFTSDSQVAFGLLESITDPGKRIDALESIEMEGFFSPQPGEPRFDVKNEPLLRKKLAEWGTEESRIDSVILKLKAVK